MSYLFLDSGFVLSRLLSAEVDMLATVSVAEGQEDPLTAAIRHVVRLIHGRMRAAGLDTPEGESVPPELEGPALDAIAWRALSRVPGAEFLLTKAREAGNEAATKIFEDIAAKKFYVSPLPSEDVDANTSAPLPTFSGRKKKLTRSTFGVAND